MQPNKTKLALALGALLMGASGASNAATGTFDITVTTIADLTITEIQPLNFGSSVFTAANSVCNLAGNDPQDADILADLAVDGAAAYSGADVALTGTGCAGSGRVGIYEVVTAGVADAVTVTINSVSNADFTFNPNSNCLAEYVTSTSATDNDTCNIMAPGVPNTLAQTGDTTNFAGTQNNALRFTVGGTLTVGGAGLTPGTPYNDVFAIDVIYQ